MTSITNCILAKVLIFRSGLPFIGFYAEWVDGRVFLGAFSRPAVQGRWTSKGSRIIKRAMWDEIIIIGCRGMRRYYANGLGLRRWRNIC